MTAYIEVLGGAVAAFVASAVAFFGWLGTRNGTAADTAEWLVIEMRTELAAREQKLAERDRTIAALEGHVARCDQELAAIKVALRSLLTVEQYEQLQRNIREGVDGDDPVL